MRPRITYANVAATLALVVATSGLAAAANPGSDGVVRGCVEKSTRRLEVPKSGKCSKGESKLSWNQTGPPGGPGGDGAPGMSGYEIVTGNTDDASGANLTAESTALCPSGKKAVGGGFTTSGTTTNVNTVYSKPFQENAWIVQTAKDADTGGGYAMTAYAVCVKVAP